MMKDDILSEEVILNTSWAMLSCVQKQNATIQSILRRIEILEAKIKENSTNSNRPPSSDSPFQKKLRKSWLQRSADQKWVTKDTDNS